MIHQALIAAPQDPPRRARSSSAVADAWRSSSPAPSAMLAGLAIGYALGVQQSFQRALTRGDRDGV
jgi:hypothetical protein